MNILVTGAYSGIGKAVKDYLLSQGHNVYALDILDIEKANNLVSFKVDITNEDEINNIKSYFNEENISLDAIINVAGIHKMASLVETSFSKMKKVIDVNLLGTMLVNNAFHPLLNKNGRVIIVTSEVAPFDPMPFNGLYNVSKTGLDCYAQALRQELNLINQKVITVRPGAVETPLSNYSMTDTQNLANETNLYQKQASKFVSIAEKFKGKPIKPIKVAKLIYKALISKRPKLIYSIHQNVGLVLLSILPKRLQCSIIKKLLNTKK